MPAQTLSELVESVRLEDAVPDQLFPSGERKLRTERNDPAYLSKLGQAIEFYERCRAGRVSQWTFQEAMTTSDFPLLFGDVLDRGLYGAYQAVPKSWPGYARRETVRDFRQVSRFATTGFRGLLTDVHERDQYPERAQDEAEYNYSVRKKGARFDLSWEMFVNDDLDAFSRAPQDLADSAADSEEFFVADLIAAADGPDGTFFTSGNENLLSGEPPLSQASLRDAASEMLQRTDDNGNPIRVNGFELVVGPGLMLDAEEILNTNEYRHTVGSDVFIHSGNGIPIALRLHVNYWLPSVMTSNADTSWWLFANPNGPRPGLVVAFLRGYESPTMFERAPDSRRLGGGDEPWSFKDDSRAWKMRHVFGGTLVDPKMTMASDGTT
jgi:hypothetical protein